MVALVRALWGIPQTSAQEDSAMEAVAVKLSGAIARSKHKTVAILDFSGPGDNVSALGESLADDLGVAITKSERCK